MTTPDEQDRRLLATLGPMLPLKVAGAIMGGIASAAEEVGYVDVSIGEGLRISGTLLRPCAGPEVTGDLPDGAAAVVPDRYMMATRASHVLGDLSRDEPSLAIIYGEGSGYYLGEWATGFGYINVEFPKKTTRDLTDDEKRVYRGKLIQAGAMARPILVDE